MRKRGRKSIASLSVIEGVGTPIRPAPPSELTKAESAEWVKVVNRLPPTWFGAETFPLLIQYVRLTLRLRFINGVLLEYEDRKDKWKDLDLRQYMALTRSQTGVSKVLSVMATKMRIAQQSTYDKRHSKETSPKKTEQIWSKDY